MATPPMRYRFLVDTCRTEIQKVLGIWAMFDDADLAARPSQTDRRGRSVLEQMVHQCVSENLWFQQILGIAVTDSPLPDEETRLEFIRRYAEDAHRRLDLLESKSERWWEEEVSFFDVTRSRAWIVTRRIAHTAHHRGIDLANYPERKKC